MGATPRLLVGLLAACCSAMCWAHTGPTVAQWVDLMQDVRKHPLFHGLKLSYARAPVEQVFYTPVGVMEREGQDCVVVIAEGDNPKMDRILQLADQPETQRVLLMTMAAHELGHCFRIRGRHLTAELWQRVHASPEDSAERRALQKTVSVEEAYADAYAFAFLQDAFPQSYAPVYQAMHSLRYDPYFATPFYQLDPLYQELSTNGLDTSLPLPQRVETLMRNARF